MAYWENCLCKLAQHSPVLFILFACWFCYCISYCLIYSHMLRHPQRYSKSNRPPTTEKQLVCIFLIQIKNYFLWFFKAHGTAHSIATTFHPNSVVVIMWVFQTRLLSEEGKITFVSFGTGTKNTSNSRATPVCLSWALWRSSIT